MHMIKYRDYPTRRSKKQILEDCNDYAMREGDYHHGLYNGIRFVDSVVKNREEAEKWIKLNDCGWYDNLAIRYKNGRKINWLVKIEFHV